MNIVDDEDKLRAWVGCLACYNNGVLIGTWIDAERATTVTSKEIHENGGITILENHEELWVFDHENMPFVGEGSPSDIEEQAKKINEIPRELRVPYFLWVEEVYNFDGNLGNLPYFNEFREKYEGEYESLQDYVQEYVHDTGILDNVDQTIISYIDWHAWSVDMSHELIEIPNDNRNVYIFWA